VKGDIYEGLLEKNARDTKVTCAPSGALPIVAASAMACSQTVGHAQALIA